MPKRSNEFQRLVFLVQKNLAQGEVVTESAMLKDGQTKSEREVDVYIQGMIAGHPVRVSVECRDHKRAQDVQWVEQAKAKHERLPTNLLILASRSGFTPEARKVAEGYGIQTVSFSEIEEIDFPTLFAEESALWVKTYTIAAAKVLIQVKPIVDLPEELVSALPSNTIFTHEGTALCSAGELVESMLRSKPTGEYLAKEGRDDHQSFQLRWEPPRDQSGNPLFLHNIQQNLMREINFIQVEGPCQIDINKFGMRKGVLGEVKVAWGQTSIAGRETLVVATHDKEKGEVVSVKFGEES
jgi:hypothetical protein